MSGSNRFRNIWAQCKQASGNYGNECELNLGGQMRFVVRFVECFYCYGRLFLLGKSVVGQSDRASNYPYFFK